ncbi:MAG: KTSC domain-containing protein [Pyrinomonadaceae bacterium]|nr:KTSC domain-containing protein [Pyrinomonadaceae bacterium]
MERSPVTSTSLVSIGYHAETQTLEIEFIKGGIYQYYGVPQHEYDDLMRAASHGQHFDDNIKKGAYSYVKVS